PPLRLRHLVLAHVEPFAYRHPMHWLLTVVLRTHHEAARWNPDELDPRTTLHLLRSPGRSRCARRVGDCAARRARRCGLCRAHQRRYAPTRDAGELPVGV